MAKQQNIQRQSTESTTLEGHAKATTAAVAAVSEVKIETPPLLRAVEENDPVALAALLSRPALSSSLDYMDIDNVNVRDTDGSGRTALHIAAAANAVSSITLLLEHGADPCAMDNHQRVPYFLAATKEARNAFRRYRALAPTQWDYECAHIPDALTDEMEALKKEKEKEKKKRAKERKKMAAAANAEKERAAAVAEEARVARLAKESACAMCGEPSGQAPFQRLQFQYCSSKCVQDHKRELMVEAAMKRQGAT
jgi:hypothetical protein